MLPIFSLFGLALAAALWPDTPTAEKSAVAGSDDSDASQEPDVTADGTLGYGSGGGNSIMSFATAETGSAMETLDASDAPIDGDYQDDLIGSDDDVLTGTAEIDALFGFAGDDVLSGGDGEDFLDGGTGDDLILGDDDQDADTLIGGEGHDQIWVGDGDTATGGRGDDVFYTDADGVSFITDYNPDDDRIELVYDPAGPVPTLTTEPNDDGINLLADGELVAVFGGAKVFDISRVAMVPDPS
jgi:Ca2+-binding RTX toxin-like protein